MCTDAHMRARKLSAHLQNFQKENNWVTKYLKIDKPVNSCYEGLSQEKVGRPIFQRTQGQDKKQWINH